MHLQSSIAIAMLINAIAELPKKGRVAGGKN